MGGVEQDGKGIPWRTRSSYFPCVHDRLVPCSTLQWLALRKGKGACDELTAVGKGEVSQPDGVCRVCVDRRGAR